MDHPRVQRRGLRPRPPSSAGQRRAGLQVPSPRGQTRGRHLSGHCRGSRLGWVGREQGFGGSAGSREPREAGRHWEAVAELRGDPQGRHRAAAGPAHSLWAHVCMGMGMVRPHPHSFLALAKHSGQDMDSVPFLSFYKSLPFTASAPTSAPWGPWGTDALTPSLRPLHPQHAPQPPGVRATYLGALLPREGPRGGLAGSIHPGGRLSAEPGSSCSSFCRCRLSPSLACSKETTDLISPWPF